MSHRNPGSNNGSRTYWTQAMERYFIDLMLEHIDRGNRIGHTFNKQAWTDMVAVFNAKFGSHYDKDVLKSRYTNLWKLFNDVKNLLSQNGFSWDKTRQMVVADSSVWNAYIKVHPEARPYITKTVLNFDHLCLIYGYTVADGRYSRSSHDVDVEDDIQGVNFGGFRSGVAPSKSSRAEWTSDMDQFFIELMVNQQERGNKLDNTFRKQAWTDMLTLFNSKFGVEYNTRVLRLRYQKLWKNYSDLMTLFSQKGFSWDEKQEMVIADNDVWDAYIEAHPHARSFRDKVFPGINNLGLIFGDVTVKESQSKERQSDCYQDKDITSDLVFAKAGDGVYVRNWNDINMVLTVAQPADFVSERSRTYWTPTMDHLLTELMLEQVHKGNRVGQSFITQAWNDMLESFNANLNSHHGRSILKSRYKHLRKQYNDVTVLLEQNGFSWDETREMVTAKDHVWDAYIKAHPDARPYRVKPVPCYQKLCYIYGQDGRMGEELNDAVEHIIDWTPPMERYFIDLMLDQVHRGNKIDDTFGEQSWAHMTQSFKEKFGEQYEHHILENRYHTLMKQYIEISTILNWEGFLWDDTRQMIIADDDTWESYTKEHPEAISYKNEVLGQYSELCIIFGPTDVEDTELDFDLGIDFDQQYIDIKIDDYYHPMTNPESESCNQAKKHVPPRPTASERCNKAQKTGNNEVQGDISSILGFDKDSANDYNLTERVVDALQAIAGMDDDLLFDGCDLLEDEKKAKTFLALDATRRKKWLLRKLGRS